MEFDRVDCFEKISVRIPKHWQDRYEEDGANEFFDPSGVSGTLRISLLTINRTNDVSLETIKQEHFEKDGEGISFFVIREEIVAAEWDEPGKREDEIQLFCGPWQQTSIPEQLDARSFPVPSPSRA